MVFLLLGVTLLKAIERLLEEKITCQTVFAGYALISGQFGSAAGAVQD
jgi:hypothetical protein